MAGVILLCGKICSGKTTYAHKLQEEGRSVILSCDELMLSLFPQGAGEHHDLLARRARDYQFALSLQIIESGIGVILDWGFWTRAWRAEARAFYQAHGVPCQLHYLDVSPEVWHTRIEARNRAVEAGLTKAYYVDAGLLKKLEGRFQAPETGEIDVMVHAE